MSRKILRIIAYAIGAIMFTCVTATIVYATGLRINGSASMPSGLYLIHKEFPKERGEIVSFCPEGIALSYEHKWNPENNRFGTCPDGAEPFIKYAVALPGDRVDVRSDGIHVNGGPALPGSFPMRNVPIVGGWHRMPVLEKKSWTIPQGEVWTYTPEWFSFDSRYYGPVRVSNSGRILLSYHWDPMYNMPASVKAIQEK